MGMAEAMDMHDELAEQERRRATMAPIPDLVVVDTETGGLDHEQHDIVEIAAVRLDARTLARKGQFEARVCPTLPVSDFAARMNGYDPDLWESTAVHCYTAIDRLNALLEGAMVVGKNPDFDWRFLLASSKRHSIPLAKRASHRMIDVTALAWPFMVNGTLTGVGLDDVCPLFGVEGTAHRAMGDVERTIAVYTRLMGLWLPAADVFSNQRRGAAAAQ